MTYPNHPHQQSGAVGNQRLASNWYSNTTSDPLDAPVTAAELANWLALGEPTPSDTVLLDGLIDAASEYFITHCSHEVSVTPRQYLLQWDRIPERQEGLRGLGFDPQLGAWWVPLPRYPVLNIDQITIGEELIDPSDYSEDLESRPGRVLILTKSLGACSNIYPLKINYLAGYTDAELVPATIRQGIYMLAGYLYEHRGACSVGQAAKESGALGMWSGQCLLMGGL